MSGLTDNNRPIIGAVSAFVNNNPDTKYQTTVNLGDYIECYDDNYVIKNFYIKHINETIIKKGYYLTFGAGKYGYCVIGHAKTVTYIPEIGMYRLEFFDEIVNAVDVDPKFTNCLLFDVLPYHKPSITTTLCSTTQNTCKQEIVIEYVPVEQFDMPHKEFHTYVKHHDNKSQDNKSQDISRIKDVVACLIDQTKMNLR